MNEKYYLLFRVEHPNGYGYGQSTGQLSFTGLENANDTGRQYAEHINTRTKGALLNDKWIFLEAVKVA
jgi:hypothetical protein